MRVDNCFFCGRPAWPSKGITFMRNDGKSFRFCRSKCHKNFKMKRNPRKLKWTKAYRKNAGKEMTVDSTLQFAARRNVPVRYDRELFAKTLKAMERISEIKARRERIFYKKRMAGKRAREVAAARKLVADNEHLLPRLRGSEKRRLAELAAERGVDVEELEREELAAKASGKKSKAFGGEVKRLRVRTDGGVEEITESFGGVVGEDDDEDDGFEDEDDEMDTD
ncbi:ATPase-activating ribosome biosynthesis protein [Podospora bellae-mahoneyi]|uniref:Ribosome biogenesis protein RLP24 n=3 Tax=Podospora TaxID=5144 RepID=A0ABY6S0P3_PODCO|nr:ATPase-activating ribosome biosynthesis protein [Podospora bellae-mahoneyi]KAK4683344.1 ATPase-activating ribosome biosynthesis protein [Podospora pseudoanserina]VBB74082.1 Putative ribosome biogenesis protein RLP24 [Podospora comata]